MKYSNLIFLLFVIASCTNKPNTAENYNTDKPTLMKESFYSIKDGNQDDQIYSAEIKRSWLDSLKTKYNWENYNQYDNRMWEYMYVLFDDVAEKSNASSNLEFWNNCTKEQKVFWSFLAFNGDTDNGGVYQFFFNKKLHAIAVLESFKELGLIQLEKDYKQTLDKFVGQPQNINSLRTIFNNQDLDWERRWSAYSEGNKTLTSAEAIENYYYNEEFKKKLHETVSDYIEANIDKFAIIIEE